jgi:hypothetical protein
MEDEATPGGPESGLGQRTIEANGAGAVKAASAVSAALGRR